MNIDSKPAAVRRDIDGYRELLERAEDAHDLRALDAMRRRPLKFRRLDDFLEPHAADACDRSRRPGRREACR